MKENFITGYCMSCKKKREIENATMVMIKNKRKAAKGQCSQCGARMYKILGKAEEEFF